MEAPHLVGIVRMENEEERALLPLTDIRHIKGNQLWAMWLSCQFCWDNIPPSSRGNKTKHQHTPEEKALLKTRGYSMGLMRSLNGWRCLLQKPADLSLSPWNRVQMERENRLRRVVLWPLHTGHLHCNTRTRACMQRLSV